MKKALIKLSISILLLMGSTIAAQEQVHYKQRIKIENQTFYEEIIYDDVELFDLDSLNGFWRLEWFEEREGSKGNFSKTRESTNMSNFFGQVNSVILQFDQDSMYIFLYPFYTVLSCAYKAEKNKLSFLLNNRVVGTCKIEKHEGNLLLSYTSYDVFFLDRYYRLDPKELDDSEIKALKSSTLNIKHYLGEYTFRESCDPENTIKKIELNYEPPKQIVFDLADPKFSYSGNIITLYDKDSGTEFKLEFIRQLIGNGKDYRQIARVYFRVLSPKKYKNTGLVYDKVAEKDE